MSNFIEFCPYETCTATMTLPLYKNSEHFGKPLSVGFYPGHDKGHEEIWIEGDCGRQNIPVQHVKAVIRQLTRAAKIAKETKS